MDGGGSAMFSSEFFQVGAILIHIHRNLHGAFVLFELLANLDIRQI